MTKAPTLSDKHLNLQQIARRRDDALRRALNTPPKLHEDMKLGKSKRKPTASASSANAAVKPEKPTSR